jgi:beta-lactamase regulating signal transducer with metallopeptidase domain
MLWFLIASTLIFAAALVLPAGRRRKQRIEVAAALVLALPLMRSLCASMPAAGGASFSLPLERAENVMPQTLLTVVWGLGLLICLARLTRQALGVRKLLRCSVPLDAAGAEEVAACLHLRLGTARQRFRISGAVATPVVAPMAPAVVLLPTNWNDWQPRLRRTALKHEWHHVQNSDVWRQVGMHLFRALLWFHPLAWRLTAAWMDECEAEADRAAVGADDAADYCSDLLSLRPAAGRPLALAPGFMNARGNRLSRRIERLLQKPCVSKEQTAGVKLFLLLALSIGCAWVGARRAQVADLREEAEVRLSAEAFPADL